MKIKYGIVFVTILYFIASVGQYFLPSKQFEGDSFGTTVLNPFYIISLILTYLFSFLAGFQSLRKNKPTKKDISLIILVALFVLGVLSFSFGIAPILLSVGFLVASVGVIISLIKSKFYSTLLFLYFILSIISMVLGITLLNPHDERISMWIPGIILNNFVNLFLLFLFLILLYFEKSNPKE